MAEESNSEGPDNVNPDENGNEGGDNRENSNVREQDRFLPIANVSKIMKKDLHCHAKIAKDAKEMMQECVSEFISFVTDEAVEKCKKEKKKTVNGDDLLWAMNELGFKDYVEVLRIYLGNYRETEVRGKESTTDKPGDADFGNREGAGPPISPAVQMGPSSAYGGGMPYAQPQTPPMMKPNSSQIGMPPETIVPGNYPIDMLPPMITPDNYHLQNQRMGAHGNQQL